MFPECSSLNDPGTNARGLSATRPVAPPRCHGLAPPHAQVLKAEQEAEQEAEQKGGAGAGGDAALLTALPEGKKTPLAPLVLREFSSATPAEILLVPSPETGRPGALTAPRDFNLMFETSVGAVQDVDEETGEDRGLTYLRPETAQGIFVNFKNVLATARVSPPFGVAQIGKVSCWCGCALLLVALLRCSLGSWLRLPALTCLP